MVTNYGHRFSLSALRIPTARFMVGICSQNEQHRVCGYELQALTKASVLFVVTKYGHCESDVLFVATNYGC